MRRHDSSKFLKLQVVFGAPILLRVAFCLPLITSHYPLGTALATQLPSLFRGVIVADSQLGVRVVSVEESSQAYQADLRPDDIIVRVHDAQIHSIDEFALLSTTLKGRVNSTTVVIFRNGRPREIVIHLYSYPILRAWGLAFVPDNDLRFAQPATGRDYWMRLGRGFEEAEKKPEALNAYLNGLHNVPSDVPVALKVAELSSRIGQDALQHEARLEGLASLRQALLVMQKLFDYSLSHDQLGAIRDQLRGTLAALRHLHSRRSSSMLTV